MSGGAERSRAPEGVQDGAGSELRGSLQGCEGPLSCLTCSQEKGGGLVLQQLMERRHFLTRSHRW